MGMITYICKYVCEIDTYMFMYKYISVYTVLNLFIILGRK